MAKRLKTITKNSAKAQRETEKFECTLKHIESAALEAYRKDVENNRDLTSIAINKKVEEENLAISGASSSKKVWREAKSDGRTYYWNTLSNGLCFRSVFCVFFKVHVSESVWEAPKEGYLSLQEQKEEENAQRLTQFREIQKQNKTQEMLR